MKLRNFSSALETPVFMLTLVLVLGFIAGVALDRVTAEGFGSFDAAVDFRLISEAWKIIRNVYVDRAAVEPQTMTYGAISGMVDSLGDTGHSRFLTPRMVKALKNMQQDKLEGIGAEIRIKAGHVVIVAPLDNSPAEGAGLRAGDIILRVDGSEITGWQLDQVVERISGPAGTSVSLTVLDPLSGRTREVTLVRATIRIHSVTWQQLPGTKVAHLRIASFGRGATADLRTALGEIGHRGLNAVILDLRNNPGGLLEEAVDAASQFLSGGNVLLVRDSHGTVKPIRVKPAGAATRIPLAVLINHGTASAAEIVAGALADAHRAEMIGSTTIGTGTVLNEFPMPDGSALLLAVEEWLTPTGQAIWHKGISPGIEVELTAEESDVFPEEERHMNVAEFRASKDPQLLRALEWLSSSSVEPAASGPHRRGAR